MIVEERSLGFALTSFSFFFGTKIENKVLITEIDVTLTLRMWRLVAGCGHQKKDSASSGQHESHNDFLKQILHEYTKEFYDV